MNVKHFPTLNLNGTSYSELVEQQEFVIEKLNDALAAMALAAPHGRDFQLATPEGQSYQHARAEHIARTFLVSTVRDSQAKILQNIVEQQIERERMRGH